jgi:hypothetical protein
MKLRTMLAMAVLSLGSLAGSAHAQQRAILQPVQWGYYGYDDHEQREYNSGYRDGSHSGMEDARHGRGFIMYDHGSYRDHRDREYREGYERGYREAYRANSYYRDHDRDRYWNHDHDWDRDRD